MLERVVAQKLLELEDMSEEEHQGLQAKVESLESIVRMLELKAKNASDHGMPSVPATEAANE